MPLPIPPRQPDSVPVLTSTSLYAFTQFWQLKPPADALILIVKGTYDLVQGELATLAEEQELPLGPTPFPEAEEAVRYPGDMAYFKPRCDVLVAGHAYAGRGGTVGRVEIALGNLSYSIAAIGDRRWVRDVPSPPERFEKLELRPERAFGGPGDETNPVGVGRVAAEGSALPNLELPDRLIRTPRDRPPPALTTPIAETWPARRRFVGTYGGDWVKRRAPYFPDDFAWDYFQAAPPALQMAYPRGDERYRLLGLRPNEEALEGRLPGVKLRAFAQPLKAADELRELPLNLDTVFFEPDLLRVQLVWRGAIGVADNYGSDLASIFVTSQPLAATMSMPEVRRQFEEAYRAEHVRAPEETEPEPPPPEPGPPAGYAPPLGLDARRAGALGLPAWAATVESPPLPPAPPPPPQPAVPPSTLATLLASNESLAGVDLSHCDLRQRSLAGRDLSGAILISARLDGVDLSGAVLRGAVLREARLVDADLRGADLTRAVLELADLGGAKLDGALLVEASLARSRAPKASFAGATLDGANAAEADWSHAKLDGASLLGADLTAARLEAVSFVSARMNEVRLYDVVAPAAVFDDAEMAGCRIDGGMFAGSSFARVKAAGSSMRACDLSECNLMEAVLEGSVLEDVQLHRSNVNQVEAKECRWHRARAVEATFVKSNLAKGVFEGVRFVDCDMRGANLYDGDTFRGRFEGCRFEHAILGSTGLG